MHRHPVLVSGVILWLLAALPTWMVDLPPLQDLPNHLASAWVQLHPDRFPDLVSNGFLKTNSALFLFHHVVAPLTGLRVAAKLFVTLTLGVGAFAYPYAVEKLGGGTARTATLVLWPFVHNWFVAMGMLDFALAVPLALLLLVALDAFDRAPSIGRGAVAAAIAALVWYTHAFVFIVTCLLVALEVSSTGRPLELRRKIRATIWLTLPLVPAIALTFLSVYDQLSTETTRVAETQYRGVLAILYGLWAEWLWSMSKWTLATIVPCAVIAFYGFRRLFSTSPRFFSPLATIALAAGCLCAPHLAFRWFYLGSRFFPFLWIALVLRFPSELPRWLRNVLAASLATWAVGLAIEYRWIAEDWKRVVAAEPAVPVRARLMTLTFDQKGRRGDNTRAFTHVASLFTFDRDAMIPSLFAHSRSFPITYVTFPPRQLEQLSLEGFAGVMSTRDHYCESLNPIYPRDCDALYRATWRELWDLVEGRYDHALLIDPSDDVLANVPSSYTRDYGRDGVFVFSIPPR